MLQNFEMTDLGLLQYFLGLEVQQKSSGITIKQQKYAIDLVNKFGMSKCEVSSTPMNTNEKL